MIYELMLFGSEIFWIIFGMSNLAILILVWASDWEPKSESIAGAVVLLGLFLGFTDCWRFFEESPLISIAFVLGIYISGGVIWSIPRWYVWLRDMRCRVLEVKRRYLKEHGIEEDRVPDGQVEGLSKEIEHHFWKYGIGYDRQKRQISPPPFTRHRQRILGWMCFWPWDLLGILLKNPVRRFFGVILDTLSSTLQRMADSVFSQTTDLKE